MDDTDSADSRGLVLLPFILTCLAPALSCFVAFEAFGARSALHAQPANIKALALSEIQELGCHVLVREPYPIPDNSYEIRHPQAKAELIRGGGVVINVGKRCGEELNVAPVPQRAFEPGKIARRFSEAGG